MFHILLFFHRMKHGRDLFSWYIPVPEVRFIVVRKQLSVVGLYVKPAADREWANNGIEEMTAGATIARREVNDKPRDPASGLLSLEVGWSAVLKGSRRTRAHLFAGTQC